MRFSIRDVLLLTVIAAVATAWGLDRWQLARRVAELEQKSQLLKYEAEMAKAYAALQQQSAPTSLKQAQVLEEAQKTYAELSAGEPPAEGGPK